MKTLVTKTLYSLLLLIVLLLGLLYFMLTTTPGLYSAIRLGKLFFPGTLSIQTVSGRLLDKGQLKNLDYHHGTIHVHIKQLRFNWHLDAFQPFALTIHTIHADSLRVNAAKTALSDIALKGHLNSDSLVLESVTFDEGGHHYSAQLSAQRHAPYDLKGELTALPSNKTSQFELKASLSGSLEHLQWSGHFNGPAKGVFDGFIKPSQNQGQLTLTLAPGLYLLPANELIPTLHYQDGLLKAELTPKGLDISGLMKVEADKQVTLKGTMPGFNLSKGLTDNQAFVGELSLVIPTLEFLKQLSPEFQNPKGQVKASLTAKGTLSKPIYEGVVLLDKASLTLPQLGLTLDSITFKAKTLGKTWDAAGTLSSANNSLLIQGKGSLALPLSADFSIKGDHFPLMNTREYQIQIAPALQIKLSPKKVDLTGTVLIPIAEIQPQTFTNSQTVPDEIVYKNKKSTQPSFFNTNMNVNLELGQEVHLMLKGLKATLTGTLNVQQQPQGPLNATGILSVVTGQYKAYGQDLEIEQGQLLFTGGRLDNPGISLRASKKINAANSVFSSFDFNNKTRQQTKANGPIKVGVEVTGRLTDPNVQLFANPALYSQADIMSLLVIGLPASEAKRGGGQLLLAALSSVDLGKNTNAMQLLEQFKQLSGLDLNVQTTTTYNATTKQFSDNTALVINKKLSKAFSVQVTSSTASSGVDILYSKSKDKKVQGEKNKQS